MEKKKFLKSVFMVLGTAVIVAGATYAVFRDAATVSGNTVSSGDADLKIKMPDPDNGCTDWSDSCSGVSWSGVYPGWNKSYNLYLKNESNSPIILQIIPVIEETGSSQSLLENTYMEITCTGNAPTGRYSLSAWKNNAAVEIAPQLRQNEESGLCEVKFDVATSASNEIANASIGFNLVLNANQVGEGTVPATCASDSDCDDSNSATIDTCNAQNVCEHQPVPPATDADADGFNSDADCNDNNALINPSATEVCDMTDNDCDGETDEGLGGGACDGDDSDMCQEGTLTCTQGALQCSDGTDDTVEVCDGADNDCDGANDNGLPMSTYYSDADGDTWGGTYSILFCNQPSGYVARNNDCDDLRAATYPGATEFCNGKDDDCNGSVDDNAASSCAAKANATPSCSSGTCQYSCIGGYTMCTDRCVNTQTDPANCGRCGNVCLGGSCSNGTCQ